MREHEGSGAAGLRQAPRRRRWTADALDAAVLAAVLAPYWRRIQERAARGAGPGASRELAPLGVVVPAVQVLSEQLGTPGRLLAGLRAVDRRTGRRPALWRTLAVIGGERLVASARGRVFGAPPQADGEQAERERRELREIWEGGLEEPARREALLRHYREHRLTGSFNPTRILLGAGGAALVNRVLRRRLAPLVLVDARARRRAHRP
jgi:hypothetical protein